MWSIIKLSSILILFLLIQYSSAAPLASSKSELDVEDNGTNDDALLIKDESSSGNKWMPDNEASSLFEKISYFSEQPRNMAESEIETGSERLNRKSYRNKYLTDPNNGPLQRKSAKKRFKADRNLQRVEKKSWNLPTQTLGHYLEIKDQAKQAARKAHELRKLLNSINEI